VVVGHEEGGAPREDRRLEHLARLCCGRSYVASRSWVTVDARDCIRERNISPRGHGQGTCAHGRVGFATQSSRL
jgi:hypothetical protein